jgi:chromosome segregation protein
MPSRLKSLELHGFKTFANRTFFEFAETVTAIVGPNGSGKSNIADSLRWVLGEQSYSLLRARKTEDMIYSGSENRPRLGMASATITFDNSDGWLPIDFSEVAITRRASRDGVNEYLINGQRVRLRNVSELLAESGLAERTYTVIGQGLVDAALALKADERRRLFEEAAGIGLHRGRREEALRRLETTQRNLERVEDILAELKPRLTSLERQARRSLEYEQVRLDLQVLLREWYGYHWHEAQKELAEARQVVTTHEQKLEQARQDTEAVEARLGSLRGRIQALRLELNQWHKQLAEQHARREETIRLLVVAEERQRSLLSQQTSDQQAILNLAEEITFQQEQLAASEKEIARLNAELDEARQQTAAARQALTARQAERLQAERLLQTARQEQASLNTRQGQLQAQLAESQSQAKRNLEALAAAQNALKEAEREQITASASRQSAQLAAQSAEQALQAAEAALQAQHKRLQESEQQLARLREQRSGLAVEQARLKAQLDVLDQAEAAWTGYAGGARLLLQAASQNRLPGARGALNAFLETPAELEKAISAALGEFLDAVLLEDDPEQALELLQRGSGRSVLLPLNALRPAPARIKRLDGDEAVLGVASELVSVPDELRPAVDLLLGSVIVARDRAAARRILAGQPYGVRAVTLQGEIFHAEGPIQAGAGESAGQQTLLGRARQRRDGQAKIKSLADEIAALDGHLSQLQTGLQAQQEENARLEQGRESARHEFQKANRLLDQAKAALDQAARQLHWNQEQLERTQVEQTHRLEDAKRISDELAKLEGRLTDARQVVRQRNAALESLALDEFQSQLSLWVTRSAVVERALSDAASRLQERQTAAQRLERSQANLQERLAGYETALKGLEDQRLAARLAETEVAEQVRLLNQQIEPAETELAGVEQEQAVQQKEADLSRQQMSATEHFHAQTRINLARRQEALSSLQRRIEDDFGLVAYEYVAQVSGPTPLPLQGMVEQLPAVRQLSPDIEENIKRQRAQLRRMGPVNPEAQAEYQEVRQRFDFLTEQVADLQQAERDVRQVINELDELMKREFRKTFEAVASEFRQIFTRLFGGGSARLLLTDPDDLTATGIEIEARLPGQRMQGLSLLSGGERSLTAVSLIFALLKVSPTPFCILDEVDAMLDEANVGRFRELLRELSQRTQFIIVTHNRNTVQAADVIYGITMGRDSSSQVLSLKLDEIEQIID